MLIVIYAKCLRNVPFHQILNHACVWIDILPSSNAIHYCQARRPTKLYFVKILFIDRVYGHVFEIFVSEKYGRFGHVIEQERCHVVAC